MLQRTILLMTVIALTSCDAPATPADAPPSLNIDRDRVTVSGISSGAYMAGQFHIAHSDLVGGAGLLAGGPYGCAQGSVQRALGVCAKGEGGGFELDNIAEQLRRLAATGAVDPLENLKDDRVWIFHGTADQVVDGSVPAAAADFYRKFMAPEQIVVVDTVKAAHGMPTVSAGAPCDEMASPFINACGYDAAGALLEHLYGPLKEPAATTGALRTMDQQQYAEAQLWEHAFLYVPDVCAKGAACGLHVAFHGCAQSAELVGDAFARTAGYNEWAETNRLLVLYPQAASSKSSPMNPFGCWDWWGYTGEHYATKLGPQIAAVKSMVDALIDSSR